MKNKRFLKKIITHLLIMIVAVSSISTGLLSIAADSGISYASESSGIEIGDHIYMGNRNTPDFTGLPYWRVIDKDGDKLFLMSEYLWTGSSEDDFLVFGTIPEEDVPMEGYEVQGYEVKGSAWQDSNAQNWCKAFEVSVLNGIEGLTIEETTITDEEFTSPDATENSGGNAHIIFAWTRDILNKDKVFFLSAEEAARYMPSTSERLGLLHNGSEVGEKKDWWLRSPRLYTISSCAGKVFAYGTRGGMIGRQVVTSLGAARPAFWASFSEEAVLESCNHGGKTTWVVNPDSSQRGFGAAAYIWSAGNKTCSASAVCNVCGQTIKENGKVSSSVTKKATVKAKGTITHKAVFTKVPFKTQTKTSAIPKRPLTALDSKLPKPAIAAPKALKKGMTVKWKKLSAANQKKVQGIEIQYALNSKFTKNAVLKTAKNNKTSLKITKLKSKKAYWVRVRTYKKVEGTKYYGKWSKAKKIKTK